MENRFQDGPTMRCLGISPRVYIYISFVHVYWPSILYLKRFLMDSPLFSIKPGILNQLHPCDIKRASDYPHKLREMGQFKLTHHQGQGRTFSVARLLSCRLYYFKQPLSLGVSSVRPDHSSSTLNTADSYHVRQTPPCSGAEARVPTCSAELWL